MTRLAFAAFASSVLHADQAGHATCCSMQPRKVRTLEVVGVEEQEALRRRLLADGDVHAAALGCRPRDQLPVLLCDVICPCNQQTPACMLMHGKDRSEVSAVVDDGGTLTFEGPDIGGRRLQQDEVGERASFRVIRLYKYLPPVLNGLLGAAGLFGAPHLAACTCYDVRMRSPACAAFIAGGRHVIVSDADAQNTYVQSCDMVNQVLLQNGEVDYIRFQQLTSALLCLHVASFRH